MLGLVLRCDRTAFVSALLMSPTELRRLRFFFFLAVGNLNTLGILDFRASRTVLLLSGNKTSATTSATVAAIYFVFSGFCVSRLRSELQYL